MSDNFFASWTPEMVAAHNARVSRPKLARQINDPQTGQVELTTNQEESSSNLVDAVPEGREIAELHAPILKWCRENNVPHYHARPDRESGVTLGAPDLCLFYRGRVLLIECKTRTGKLSEDQRNWIHLAERQGFKVEIVRSMKRFWELIARIDADDAQQT